MTAQQALVTLQWFNCMDGGVDVTAEDLDVIEKGVLPLLKDNNNVIQGTDMSYHQMYLHWITHLLPDLKKMDCI